MASDAVDIAALLREADATGQSVFVLLKQAIFRAISPQVGRPFLEQQLLIQSVVILNLGLSLVALPLRATDGLGRPFVLRCSRRGTFYRPTISAWLAALVPFLVMLLLSTILCRKVFRDSDATLLATEAWFTETWCVSISTRSDAPSWMPLWICCWLVSWSIAVDSFAPESELIRERIRTPQAVGLNLIGGFAPIAFLGSVLPYLVIAHIHLRRGNHQLLLIYAEIDAARTLLDLTNVAAIAEVMTDELYSYISWLQTGERIWLGWTSLLTIFITVTLVARVRQSRREIASLSSYQPTQTLRDVLAYPPIESAQTAIPADVSIRHLKRSLTLDIVQLGAIAISSCCYLGVLAWKTSDETAANTTSSGVQILRLTLAYCYVFPGTTCAVISFYQSLPTRHSQGIASSALDKSPIDQSGTTPAPSRTAAETIRVGFDIEALIRQGGSKDLVGF